MLTYADVCWRMLTYADKQLSYEQQKRKGQVTYAHVCSRMLTYADMS
jgi:hypothetical protein